MDSFNQFQVNIYSDVIKENHLHTDVELIYVVEGVINIRIKDKLFSMKKDDVMVINSSIQHSVESLDKSIICSIKFDYRILVHVIRKPNSVFVCDSVSNPGRSYNGIIRQCREIIYHEVAGYGKTDTLKYSMLYGLLNELIENYMIDDAYSEISENYDADEKLQAIIHYVHSNYQEGISLSDLAKQMYTSTSTLSRLFKKQTGTYFAEYVNQVRTRYAVDELLYTEKNMTRIAMDCGFSNASAFTKVFRENYNMAPTEYRQKMKSAEPKDNVIDDSIREEIENRYKSEYKKQEIKNTDSVSIDVSHSEDLNRCWNQIINVGFIHDILNANSQYHISYLAKELGFKYARIWMLFNSRTLVTDGKSVGDYNYDLIYEALDFLLKNGVTPWIDFTTRPYANVKNSDESVWQEDIRIHFKDKKVWDDLFRQFFKGLVRRYGVKELSGWVFELGPKDFHVGVGTFNLEESLKFVDVFCFVQNIVKKAIPDAKIAYSAGAGFQNPEVMAPVLKRLSELDSLPDYVTYILFPYKSIQVKENNELRTSFVRTKENEFEEPQLKKIFELMEKSGLGKDRIAIAEWNLTASNCNFINDSNFRGCVFTATVSRLLKDIHTFGLWICSDWQCTSFTSRNIINGGGGLLTKDTIRKPIYYAVRMLNHLGNKVIARGQNFMATKLSDDEYAIICFNPVVFNPSYFIKAENQANVEEVHSFFNYEANKRLKLKLEGVSTNSWYYVKKRTVNRQHGSIIDEWAKFDNAPDLARNDVKYLQELCVPGLTRTRQQSKGNVLTLDVDLEAEEFCLIHVFPQY
jgi:beta-xylosidase/AraC-like DNA-binding protein